MRIKLEDKMSMSWPASLRPCVDLLQFAEGLWIRPHLGPSSPRQRPRQTELGQDPSVPEPRQPRDAFALEREHDHPEGPADRGLSILDVVTERGLGVRARRDE